MPIPDKPRGLLALDIDGTLLGPGGVLSDRTRFIQMAVENPGPILLQDALKVPFAANPLARRNVRSGTASAIRHTRQLASRRSGSHAPR